MNKTISSPAFKFAGVGFLNVFITLLIVFALKEGFGVDDVPANFIGYVAGLLSSFILNKRWTFGNDSGTFAAFLRFIVVFAASYLLNILTVLTALRVGMHDYLAHIMGMPVYSLVFYLGCRSFAFPAPKTSHMPSHFQADHVPYRENQNPRREQTMRFDVWIWFILTFVFSAIILFYRLGELPIVLWDEARLANNALEMSRSGLSLITTYNWSPDHWNTKPPALIWAMACAIKLFGPGEIAVRLPSALSSLATSMILFSVCAWHLRRPVAGFIAVLLLYATPGYVLFHGARSGDYEALLILGTTSYLIAGYLMLQAKPAEKPVWLAICSGCIVLSFLTKTIQGMIMLPPLIAFVCIKERSGLFLRARAFLLAGLFIIAICAGYYLLREQYDPGYFKAVQANDLAGRYANEIEQHGQDWTWYLNQTRQFPWLIPCFLVAGWQLRQGMASSRPLILLLFIASVFYFVIISSARTKLVWYAAPLSPLCALIMAIGLTGFLETYGKAYPFVSPAGLPLRVLLSAAAATVILFNLNAINTQIAKRAADYLDAYSVFLRSTQMDKFKTAKLAVIHPGYQNQQNDPYYIAPPLFYVNRLRVEGRDVRVMQQPLALPHNIDTILACGPVRAHVERLIPRWLVTENTELCTVYSAPASALRK
jgi:4-amino-4-deoxy-L-arabinose transferase-like glycosyltransferase/putative flippase GtrA